MSEIEKILRSKKRTDTKIRLLEDLIAEVRNDAFDKAKAHYQQGGD